MIKPLLTRKWLFVFIAIFISTCVLTAGVFSARRLGIQKPRKQVVTLPEVVSHVPRLRVTNVSVKNPLTPDATAVVEILNTSNVAVMSVEISTNKDGDSGAVNEDGLMDTNNPRVVIPPFGTTTLEMSFSEMVADAPLVVSAAEFADGTEEGDKWSRQAMRAVRAKRKAQKKGGY
jgi:hypothetical protein